MNHNKSICEQPTSIYYKNLKIRQDQTQLACDIHLFIFFFVNKSLLVVAFKFAKQSGYIGITLK